MNYLRLRRFASESSATRRSLFFAKRVSISGIPGSVMCFTRKRRALLPWSTLSRWRPGHPGDMSVEGPESYTKSGRKVPIEQE